MALLLVAAMAIAACGGEDDGDPAAEPDPTTATAVTTTTTRPAPTTTTTVPPYSFDGSVPPPELIDTGDDYEAIAESLLAYIAWLKRHNPDPELLPDVIVEGTQLMEKGLNDLSVLRKQNVRFVDVGQQISAEVANVDGDLVTLFVEERIQAERLVDADGNVVDERPSGPVNEYLMVLVSDASGRWRIADVARRAEGAEVRL